MDTSSLIPALALLTLGIVLVVAIVQLMAFRKKRRNREADRGVDMGRRPVTDDGQGAFRGVERDERH